MVKVENPEDAQEAFDRIERLIAASDKASSLLRQRLGREGFSSDAITQALERACRCGLVDDNRYASSLVRGRLAAHKGVYGIQIELEELEIYESLQDICPDYSFDDEEELHRALEVLGRKTITAKNKREAAYRRLISKGYASTIAARAARLWSESLGGTTSKA